MNQKNKILIFVLMLLFILPMTARADLVDITSTDPNNVITFDPAGANAKESVVNLLEWSKTVYVTVNATGGGGPLAGTDNIQLTFNIDNDSKDPGFIWTDYHFKIDPSSFKIGGSTAPAGIDVTFTDPANTNAFKEQIPSPAAGHELSFYYDGTGGSPVAPGEQLNGSLRFLFTGFDPGSTTENFTFVMTQQATGAAVPLPGAVLLLGSGLVRLVAYARKRQD